MITKIKTVVVLLGGGLTGKGHEETFWSNRNVLFLDRVMSYVSACIRQTG